MMDLNRMTQCISIVLSLLLVFLVLFWTSMAYAATTEDADLVLSQRLARTEGLAGELRQPLDRFPVSPSPGYWCNMKPRTDRLSFYR